jgi:hypothetical protein
MSLGPILTDKPLCPGIHDGRPSRDCDDNLPGGDRHRQQRSGELDLQAPRHEAALCAQPPLHPSR